MTKQTLLPKAQILQKVIPFPMISTRLREKEKSTFSDLTKAEILPFRFSSSFNTRILRTA